MAKNHTNESSNLENLVVHANVSKWEVEHENILSRIADGALCYEWLARKSEEVYHLYSSYFSIPIICISTITGIMTFAQSQIPTKYQSSILMVTGSFNIAAGVLHTLQQSSKVVQTAEKFKLAVQHWQKLHSIIRFELQRRREERTKPGVFLDMCEKEYQKLVSMTPTIPTTIINSFNSVFQDKRLQKPEICIESIVPSRNLIFPHELSKGVEAINIMHDMV